MNPCPTCASVHFVPRRAHRNGTLAVALGYFLLVPSILVVVLGSMGVVSRPGRSLDAAREASAELVAAQVPAPVVARVSSYQPLSAAELESLSADQQHSVLKAQMAVANGSSRESLSRFTSGRAFQLLVGLAVASGIFGWFLLRKQSVAQCINCGGSASAA